MRTPEEFMEYFRTNYPGPNTIINSPDWHAPKIYRAAIAASPEAKVCADILRIMATYREQEAAGNVDTPGGLEHMGDVWKLLRKWEAALNRNPRETRYCSRTLGHPGECFYGSFTYLGGDKCSAERSRAMTDPTRPNPSREVQSERDALKAEVERVRKTWAANWQEQKDRVERLTRDLAECFVWAGSESSGRGIEVDASRAVAAVKELRKDYDEDPGEMRKLKAQVEELMAAASKDTPLSAKIVGAELQIRVGIDVIKWAAENMEANNTWVDNFVGDEGRFVRSWKITDASEFSKDVVRKLLAEEEDGSTMLSIFLDKACLQAIEDGSLGVDDDGTEAPVQ